MRVEVSGPVWLLLLWVWVGQFFPWCLARVEQLLSKSFVFPGCPFPCPLARLESRLSLEPFSSVLMGVSGFLASSVPSLGK